MSDQALRLSRELKVPGYEMDGPEPDGDGEGGYDADLE
jgi:hypothetical protein